MQQPMVTALFSPYGTAGRNKSVSLPVTYLIKVVVGIYTGSQVPAGIVKMIGRPQLPAIRKSQDRSSGLMETEVSRTDQYVHRKRLITVSERQHTVLEAVAQHQVLEDQLSVSYSHVGLYLEPSVSCLESHPEVFYPIIPLRLFFPIS